LRAYNAEGGSIIEYERVVSCLIVSQKSSHYVWVPPNGSRLLRSLPDTLLTLLFGWWSIHGFFWTIGVLISNLAGGRDATEELLDATQGGNVELAQQAVDDELRGRRKESVRAVLQFAGIILGIVLVFGTLIKVTEWWMSPPRANQTVAGRESYDGSSKATTQPGAGLRLQAIFDKSKGRSTAIIDERTVSFGDRVGGCLVVDIEEQSVALKSATGEKVVLHMTSGGR
jgi:hypothetical protein